jgi:hypothetical protein
LGRETVEEHDSDYRQRGRETEEEHNAATFGGGEGRDRDREGGRQRRSTTRRRWRSTAQTRINGLKWLK